jgi:lysozyme
MARRKGRGRSRWRVPAFLSLGVFVLVLAFCGWWTLTHWRPDKGRFPVQGIEVDAESGVVDWPGVKAAGATFAYLDATAGAFARDPAFLRGLHDARAAGLRVGAVHRYDPCQPANRQAANFAAFVPHDPAMLAPAIELSQTGDDCPVHVTDAAVQRGLMTFIDQIEAQSGKPVVLKLSPEFERRYGIAARIDRKLWLTRRVLQPDYAGRPWTLWTANPATTTEVAEHALRWVAARR